MINNPRWYNTEIAERLKIECEESRKRTKDIHVYL